MNKLDELIHDHIENQTRRRVEMIKLEMRQAEIMIELGKLQLGDNATNDEISILVSKQLGQNLEYCKAIITTYERNKKYGLN